MLNKDRLDQLLSLWENETNEDDTQEWRGELSSEEKELVASWDGHYCESIGRLCQKIEDVAGPG